MDILYGFLIGLAYPPMLVIVVASLIAARVSFAVIGGVIALIVLAGPVVWVMIFVAFGIGAGFVAFAGWTLGLGVAAAMTVLLVISRARRRQMRRPAAWSR